VLLKSIIFSKAFIFIQSLDTLNYLKNRAAFAVYLEICFSRHTMSGANFIPGIGN